jgi:hypothetical protein
MSTCNNPPPPKYVKGRRSAVARASCGVRCALVVGKCTRRNSGLLVDLQDRWCEQLGCDLYVWGRREDRNPLDTPLLRSRAEGLTVLLLSRCFMLAVACVLLLLLRSSRGMGGRGRSIASHYHPAIPTAVSSTRGSSWAAGSSSAGQYTAGLLKLPERNLPPSLHPACNTLTMARAHPPPPPHTHPTCSTCRLCLYSCGKQ